MTMTDPAGTLALTATPSTWLCSPEADVQGALLTWLATAKQRIRAILYTATLPAYYDALLALHARGGDVRLILDASQYAQQPSEVLQVARLTTAGFVEGQHYVIGHSQHHDLVHTKCTILDGRRIAMGSYNVTHHAEAQHNLLVLLNRPALAAWLEARFDVLWASIAGHPA